MKMNKYALGHFVSLGLRPINVQWQINTAPDGATVWANLAEGLVYSFQSVDSMKYASSLEPEWFHHWLEGWDTIPKDGDLEVTWDELDDKFVAKIAEELSRDGFPENCAFDLIGAEIASRDAARKTAAVTGIREMGLV
jgi:hypothetical protein